ncbi:hypothetical protein [Paenibacillus taiwanensis]|uniref:hypothetical protein n=1 Tax=Paenibacillus taiwanensis TaxID=401638 RepID=UPI0012FB355D|nr:hypothetical protein [Paenibacillus taiwanensis]
MGVTINQLGSSSLVGLLLLVGVRCRPEAYRWIEIWLGTTRERQYLLVMSNKEPS